MGANMQRKPVMFYVLHELLRGHGARQYMDVIRVSICASVSRRLLTQNSSLINE